MAPRYCTQPAAPSWPPTARTLTSTSPRRWRWLAHASSTIGRACAPWRGHSVSAMPTALRGNWRTRTWLWSRVCTRPFLLQGEQGLVGGPRRLQRHRDVKRVPADMTAEAAQPPRRHRLVDLAARFEQHATLPMRVRAIGVVSGKQFVDGKCVIGRAHRGMRPGDLTEHRRCRGQQPPGGFEDVERQLRAAGVALRPGDADVVVDLVAGWPRRGLRLHVLAGLGPLSFTCEPRNVTREFKFRVLKGSQIMTGRVTRDKNTTV